MVKCIKLIFYYIVYNKKNETRNYNTNIYNVDFGNNSIYIRYDKNKIC